MRTETEILAKIKELMSDRINIFAERAEERVRNKPTLQKYNQQLEIINGKIEVLLWVLEPRNLENEILSE